MTALLRAAAKLFLVLQISIALACSDGGPGGPADQSDGRFAGHLTVSGSGDDAASGQAFQGAAALADVRLELVSGGAAVAAVTTSDVGVFSTSLPAGAYTVRIPLSDGPPLEFALTLPAGGSLFAQGRVDQTPAGEFTLNVQLFRDQNADARADDAFRVQILDRVQGDAESGFEDVVASQEEAAESVTLCHVPPGNPDAAHTVSVGAPAVPAHLAHGDVEGECAEDDSAPDEGEEGEEGEDSEGVKLLVCHVPPGNPGNPVTIEIAESALPAHLAHGDTEGACQEASPSAPDEGGEEEGGEGGS